MDVLLRASCVVFCFGFFFFFVVCLFCFVFFVCELTPEDFGAVVTAGNVNFVLDCLQVYYS